MKMPDNEEIIETTEPEINVIPSGVGNFKIEKYPRVMFVNSSTDELADAVLDEVLDDTVDAIERIAREAPSAREAIDGLCAEMARRFEAGNPLALATTNELAHAHGNVLSAATERLDRIVRVVEGQIERAREEGIVREDADASLVATFVVGGFLLTSIASASGMAFPNKEDLASALVDLSLRGAGPR